MLFVYLYHESPRLSANSRLAFATYHRDYTECLATIASGANPNGLPRTEMAHSLIIEIRGAIRSGTVRLPINPVDNEPSALIRWLGSAHMDNQIDTTNDHPEVTQALVNSGAKVNVTNEYLETPLYLALVNGLDKSARILIEHGADVNARDHHGSAILTTFGAVNDAKMCRLLISHGAVAAVRDPSGFTAVDRACQADNPESVELLLAAGASPSGSSASGANGYHFGDTPLVLAIQHADMRIVRMLVEHGADVNEPTEYGYTPLMMAAIHGQLKTAQFLLKQGAKVNDGNYDNHTALMFANEHHHSDLANLLSGKRPARK